MSSVSERLTVELAATPSLDAAFKLFEIAVRPYGFISVDYASGPVTRWPMQGNLDWRPDVIYATFNWQAEYFGTDFQKHDRTLPHMLKQTTPWLYWDLWRTPPEDPVAREMERRVHERIRSGLSIPFHGPGLRFAGVNLGSDLEPDDLEQHDRENRPVVFLLAYTLHEHVRRRTGDLTPPPRLSTRQLECLTWTARGKTAWETGQILSISESSVKKHLAAAGEALGARTGAHAVAVAMSAGLIAR